MEKVSIIITSYKDKDLQRTIDDINDKSRGNIEIIAVLDNYNEKIKDAKFLITEKRVGMRKAITLGVEFSSGEYILKCDAHCIFDEDFDVKLLKDIKDNWVVIPCRFFLDTDVWEVMNESPIDYERLVIDKPEKIGGVKWRARAKERKKILIDETMVFQGSCWMMSRKHWNRIGGLPEEGYGTFTQEPIQIALKTWLGGGKVMVNKKTWYAHKHRKFGRNTHLTSKEIKNGNKYSKDFWLNNRWKGRIHDLDWLMKRFGL